MFFCCAAPADTGAQHQLQIEARAFDATKSPPAEIPIAIVPTIPAEEAAAPPKAESIVAAAVAAVENVVAAVEHVVAKVEGKAEPATAAPTVFEVDLDRTKGDGKFGLDLDSTVNCGVQVIRVTGGAVAKHNESAPDHQKIARYDFIAAANGKTEAAEIAKVFSSSDKVKVRVVRPHEVQVQVAKEGKAMGMRLSYQENSSITVEIKSLSDGRVKDVHNVSATPATKLNEGDFIKAVNGVSGNAIEMVNVLKTAEVLNFTVLKVK